jgi:hypothetical protein
VVRLIDIDWLSTCVPVLDPPCIHPPHPPVDVVSLIRTVPAGGKKVLVPVLGRPHLVVAALSEEYTKGLKVGDAAAL